MQALKMIDNFKLRGRRKFKEFSQSVGTGWYSHRNSPKSFASHYYVMSFEEYSIVPLKMYKFMRWHLRRLRKSDAKLLIRNSSPVVKGCNCKLFGEDLLSII